MVRYVRQVLVGREPGSSPARQPMRDPNRTPNRNGVRGRCEEDARDRHGCRRSVGRGRGRLARRGRAGRDSGPSMKTQLASVLGDQKWATPKPGSWTMPKPPQRPARDRQPHRDAGEGRLPHHRRRLHLRLRVRGPRPQGEGSDHDVPDLDLHQRPGQYFWAMRNAGSPMENHTINHPNMATLGADAQKKQICEASDEIEKQYGRRRRSSARRSAATTRRPCRSPRSAASSRCCCGRRSSTTARAGRVSGTTASRAATAARGSSPATSS